MECPWQREETQENEVMWSTERQKGENFRSGSMVKQRSGD